MPKAPSSTISMNSIQRKLVLNTRHVEAFVFALCVFCLTPPFFLWNNITTLVFIIPCSFLTLRNISTKRISYFVFFLLLIFYLYAVYVNGMNTFGLIAVLGICLLALTSKEFLILVFQKYILIFSITLIPSLISYGLVYGFGLKLPINYIEPLNALKLNNYLQYPFFVIGSTFYDSILPRFYSYYDEPGMLGTIAAVLLISTGFNLRKKINIPIFISGLFSFSLAFYLISIGYASTFVSNKNKFLLVLMLIGLFYIFSENEVANQYLLKRIQINDGKLVGDNRINDKNFDSFYKTFQESDDFWFGIGNKASLIHNLGGASYKDLIVDYGIIPFVYFIAIFLGYAFSIFRFRKEFFTYILIIVLIIYQRPFITLYFYVFLLLAPILMISTQRKLSTA